MRQLRAPLRRLAFVVGLTAAGVALMAALAIVALLSAAVGGPALVQLGDFLAGW